MIIGGQYTHDFDIVKGGKGFRNIETAHVGFVMRDL